MRLQESARDNASTGRRAGPWSPQMGRALADVEGRIVPLAEAVLPVTDPAVTSGWSVFETLRVHEGRLPLAREHLDRLEQSAAMACIPMPDRSALASRAAALAHAHGGAGRLRITLTGGGRVLLTVEDVPAGRLGQPIRAVRGPHRDEPFLGGACKHASRAPWVVAVRRSGVDEVLLVDGDGTFTEATTAGILAVIDGVLWSAPEDGRILASTTVAELFEAAARLGLPTRRARIPADGGWQGLYVASATRWIAPVVLLDGEALPGWEAVGQKLHEEGPPR